MSFEKVILEYENKKGEGVKEEMEEHKLKNISGENAKRILEIADQENIDIEAIIDFIKGVKKMSNDKEKKDEERYTEEVKKVEKYQSEHPDLSYRDCVLACLDRSEPAPKKEFTKEEITKRENLKACQNYILANPGASWKDAVRVILHGEELTLEEKLIDEYLEKNPGSDYKTAVIESLSLLKKEEKEE